MKETSARVFVIVVVAKEIETLKRRAATAEITKNNSFEWNTSHLS